MNWKWTVVCAGVLGIATNVADAQGPPINTDTPITLGLQGRGVRTFGKVVRMSGGPGERVTATAWPVVVPYNITTKGVAGVIVPTVFKEAEKGGARVSSSGLGDVSVFAKYVVLQIDRPQETFRLAPKAVVKFATGDEKEAPPLGTGSTNLSLGAVGAWLKGRSGIYVETLFQVNGASGGKDLGNGLVYNAALPYRLRPAVYETYPAQQVNAYLELNGSWTDRDRLDGRSVNDSGGHMLFLSPGIQYIPVSQFLVETSVQIPVVKDLHGAQMEPDWTISAGIRILLF